MELFRIIENKNTGTTFNIYPDPAHVDRDYLQAAGKANCRIISLGVETMDPDAAAEMNRKFDHDEFFNALDLLRGKGDTPQVDMMYGLPKQSVRSFGRDLVRLRLEQVDQVLFSPLMIFPGTELEECTEDKGISTLDCPQQYGYNREGGKDEYASLIMMSESYQFLRQFHRTDYYIRSVADCRSDYERVLEQWFFASVDKCRNRVLALQEEMAAGSAYIRTNAESLTQKISALFIESMDNKLQELEFLFELVRMDILEVAMKRMNDERARDIHPRLPSRSMILPEEFIKLKWVLSEEAWLETHAVPYELASRGGSHTPGEEPNRVFCVYFCPESKIFFVDENEFDFLGRFSKPRRLFDSQNAYSSEALETAGKWSRLGVLRIV